MRRRGKLAGLTLVLGSAAALTMASAATGSAGTAPVVSLAGVHAGTIARPAGERGAS
jgi:hypothetical protein